MLTELFMECHSFLEQFIYNYRRDNSLKTYYPPLKRELITCQPGGQPEGKPGGKPGGKPEGKPEGKPGGQNESDDDIDEFITIEMPKLNFTKK